MQTKSTIQLLLVWKNGVWKTNPSPWGTTVGSYPKTFPLYTQREHSLIKLGLSPARWNQSTPYFLTSISIFFLHLFRLFRSHFPRKLLYDLAEHGECSQWTQNFSEKTWRQENIGKPWNRWVNRKEMWRGNVISISGPSPATLFPLHFPNWQRRKAKS